jgi:16S rRNA (adenine1518-N6/adenine1519-N6)-dimethyltransferase
MTFRDPRDVLKDHGLWTKKQFGQNFLIDGQVVERIVNVSGALPDDIAYEIGAGCGTLTTMIAPKVQRLVSLEYDRNLIPVLDRELSEYEHVEIRSANVLDIDWQAESESAQQPLMLFGNLPYHLSSEIILSLIDKAGYWRRACFMVQKEFGERLAATAGTRESSALSVQLQLIGFTSVAFYVPPESFVPAPKVDSCVIIIEAKSSVNHDPDFRKAFRVVVRSLFGQRRKMARRALKTTGLTPETLLNQAGLDGRRRGETYNLDELRQLAAAYQQLT